MLTTTIKFKVSVLCAILVSLTVSAQNSTSYLNSNCYRETSKVADNATKLNIEEPLMNIDCDIPSATSCTVDGKQLNTSSGFENDCLNLLKGKMNYENMVFTCSEAGKSEKFTFNYLNYPKCFGSSCTDDQIDNMFRTLYYPMLEIALKSQGLPCTAAEMGGSTSETGGSKSLAITSRPGITKVAVSGTVLLLVIAQYFP
jgi:hypothetical protein